MCVYSADLGQLRGYACHIYVQPPHFNHDLIICPILLKTVARTNTRAGENLGFISVRILNPKTTVPSQHSKTIFITVHHLSPFGLLIAG